ncbi:MAG: DUF2442 domain-containing protein [Terriglobia bacterium]|jgi:hypothetical protein
MGSLSLKLQPVKALRLAVTGDALTLDLSDGRTVSAPLALYPRLLHGNAKERDNWRLIGDGEGVHWPDLDEDLSVESVILGRASGESQTSLKRWLESRKASARRVRAPKLKSARKASHAQRVTTRRP